MRRPSAERAAARAAAASSLSTAMVTTMPGRTTPEVSGRSGRLRVCRSSMVSVGTPAGCRLFLARSSSAATGDAAALLGGHAAPDPVLFAVAQGLLQTLGPDGAGGTDGESLGLFLGRGRKEDLGVEISACSFRSPGAIPHDHQNVLSRLVIS